MRKSTAIAYTLWALLGSFGAHRFYVGRHGDGMMMLALGGLGTLLSAFSAGWAMEFGVVLAVAASLWSLADFRRLRSWIEAPRAGR